MRQGNTQPSEFDNAPVLNAIAHIAFLVLILTIFVTFQPFTGGYTNGEIIDAQGNILKQVTLVLSLGLAAIPIFLRRGINAIGAIPVYIWPILLWVLLSLSWSDHFDTSIRRVGILLVVTFGTLFCVSNLGSRKVIQMLYWVLAGVLIVDLVSAIAIPQYAVHQAATDPLLAGKWKGLHSHKNVQSVVALFGIFVFWTQHQFWKKWFDWILMVVGLIVLLGSASKTVLGFGFPCMMLLGFMKEIYKSGRSRMILGVCFGGALISLGFMTLFAQEALSELLSEPTAFTGRVAIWNILIAYGNSHPWTGSGYGAFWQIGTASPAFLYTKDMAVITAPHGHNGYIDMLAALGYPGLILMLACVVVAPIMALISTKPTSRPEFLAFAAAALLYTFLHNFLETSFLDGNDEAWLLWLVAVGIIRQEQRRAAAQGVSRRRRTPSSRQDRSSEPETSDAFGSRL